jgi:hypothetical protein
VANIAKKLQKMRKKEKKLTKNHIFIAFFSIFPPKRPFLNEIFHFNFVRGRAINLPSTNHLRAFPIATVLLVSSYRLEIQDT